MYHSEGIFKLKLLYFQVIHSRDKEGVGVVHKVNSPKNQPQFSDGVVLVR